MAAEADHEGVVLRRAGAPDIYLSLDELASPSRMRAAVYAQTGTSMPHYGAEDHAQIVRVIGQLADAGEGRGDCGR